MNRPPPRQPYQDALLDRLLRECFGALDEPALALLRQHLEWLELPGGQCLMEQGTPGDAMYLLVSGRLRVTVRPDTADAGNGGERLIGEVTRGQIVGEMALYTDEPRMATVRATRDAVLVRLGKPAFDRLVALHAGVSLALTRQIIARLKQPSATTSHARPSTIGLLPVSAGIDLPTIADRLAAHLGRYGRVAVIDSARADQALNLPEATLGPQAHLDINRRVALLLDRIEAASDFVLLLADAHPSAWTARCCRDADELLLLADATEPPQLHPIERLCLLPGDAAPPATPVLDDLARWGIAALGGGRRAETAELLVLLHPEGSRAPQGTAAWLDRRPVAGHLHLRRGHDGDLARLARTLARTATGLVLAGGGARGLAHLGVWRALRERGIEIDAVGGTSIGAVMAAYVASDQPYDTVLANARRAFGDNPTGDWNPWPSLSLFRGRRLRRILQQAVHQLLGSDADAEDLWKPFFCVTTNYSQAREQVLRRGPLAKVLRASTAIPGALPPVLHEGELLCDGGSFNNFPVDVMRAQRGVGRVIGIDLDFRQPLKVDLDDVPGGWSLFVDQFRTPRRKRYRLPSLAAYLMTVMVLYSISRSRRSRTQADLYFNPPLERVGLLQWNRFDRIVQRGYEHALAVLDGRAADSGTATSLPPQPS
jgi:NTE family protein